MKVILHEDRFEIFDKTEEMLLVSLFYDEFVTRNDAKSIKTLVEAETNGISMDIVERLQMIAARDIRGRKGD